jgi:hypothetical protein
MMKSEVFPTELAFIITAAKGNMGDNTSTYQACFPKKAVSQRGSIRHKKRYKGTNTVHAAGN